MKQDAQLLFLTAFLVYYLIGLNSYSGKNKPQLYGDLEAQRHFMETTFQLNINEWYWYDLEYWGLDYPPLTAYHSWLLGYIANWINPKWMELVLSRGMESPLLIKVTSGLKIVSSMVRYIITNFSVLVWIDILLLCLSTKISI